MMSIPLFRFFADLRLGAIILVILAVASGVGTFIESNYTNLGSSEIGRAAAYDMVYDAMWFNVLLVVLFVNLLFNLFRRLARGRQPLGFLLVHVGMLVILIGAGITRWYGFEGYLHIREGQANNEVRSAQNYATVMEGNHEAHMPVRLYKAGSQRHQGTMNLPQGAVKLAVAEFWPRFERRMMPGPGGTAMVTLSAMGAEGGVQMHTLAEGDQETIGGVQVMFHRDGLPSAADPTARYGQIRVRAGGEVCRLNVRPEPTTLGECGGWSFAVTGFESDFHTGGESDPDGPLLNPMVKLLVTNPSGESAEKSLFALHPDFGMMHEEAELLSQVDLLYEIASGVDLAKQDDQVVMRASFPMQVTPMAGDGSAQSMAAGEIVTLALQQVYQGAGDFKIVPSKVDVSVIQQPVLSESPGAPAAARLTVAADGHEAEAICIQGAGPQQVRLGDRTLAVSYGSIIRRLPYSLYLEDFRLETYPGSENPASYESHVLLRDPEMADSDETIRIWMNNPLNHRGRKHFQSSYDRDRLGTVLSVNQDPGKTPTYVGYTIFTLGFVVIMARIFGARRRASALVLALAVAAGALAPHAAQAQTQSPQGGASPTTPPPMLNLPDDVREQAARLIVQDYRGRMKPLDTLAREMAMKVTKKSSFEGRHPIEVFLGFVAHPAQWYNHPAVSVKNPGVQDLLGVSRETHHVSIASLLEGGRYRLTDEVEEAHRTSANHRTKTQQKLITFDERVHLLYNALQGSSLRLFPIPDDPGNTWQELQVVIEGLREDDPRREAFLLAGDALFGGLEAGNVNMVRDGLARTAALQTEYGAEVVPGDFRIDSELLLNSTHPFARSTLPYLAAFLLLIVAYFWGLFRHDGQPWRWRSPLFALGMLAYLVGFAMHTWGFVMRWIASGRAPLSNGHESLLWVALAVALAGFVFEARSRTAAAGALGSLLAAVVLGVAMMSAFDPAIGPLVPVLASYWLNIHVTIITASYGFLGLCCLLGMLTMILVIIAATSKRSVSAAVQKLDRLNVDVMLVGLALLGVGTLLGGVWANESWGRYWGWDPKETWALVSVLVYAIILHFRWIPSLANPYVHAVGSFLAIWSIVMTYFGVNYLLVGLHSYAAGEATTIPGWVVVTFLVMLALSVVSGFAWTTARQRLKVRGEAGA